MSPKDFILQLQDYLKGLKKGQSVSDWVFNGESDLKYSSAFDNRNYKKQAGFNFSNNGLSFIIWPLIMDNKSIIAIDLHNSNKRIVEITLKENLFLDKGNEVIIKESFAMTVVNRKPLELIRNLMEEEGFSDDGIISIFDKNSLDYSKVIVDILNWGKIRKTVRERIEIYYQKYKEVILKLKESLKNEKGVLKDMNLRKITKSYTFVGDPYKIIGTPEIHYEITTHHYQYISVDLHFEYSKEQNDIFHKTIKVLPDNIEWIKWGESKSLRVKPILEIDRSDIIEKIKEQLLYLENQMGNKVREIMKENGMIDKDTLLENPETESVKETISLNQILFGPPGTGKTFNTINMALEIIGKYPDGTPLKKVDLEKMSRNEIKKIYDGYIDSGRIVFTTFHQSMSYEDFVEGIKPVLKGDNESNIQYEIQDGIFKKICEKAENEEDNYVLIIDEINRGNVSSVFGELITLIEEDKRIGNSEEIRVVLPYSKDEKKKFGVPSNLYIIGTMNTADRSVEALDTALRRRFTFVSMPPDIDIIRKYGKLENGILKDYQIDLAELLETINSRIEILLDNDHLIGHSYFMNVENINDLKLSFAKQIIPLLQEYFYGDYGKISLVLGTGFCKPEEINDISNAFAYVEGYDIDPFSDKIIYKLTDVMKMKDDVFVNAINLLLKK
jgi:5-methylcytosine-specific restriction protein B